MSALAVLLLGAFWLSVRRDGAKVKRAAIVVALIPGLAGTLLAMLIMGQGPVYVLGIYDMALAILFAVSLGHPAYGLSAELLQRPPRQPSPHPAYYVGIFASQQHAEPDVSVE